MTEEEQTPVKEYQHSMYKYQGIMYEQLDSGIFTYFDKEGNGKNCHYIDLGMKDGNEIHIIPISNKTTMEKVVPLPTGMIEYGTTEQLISDIDSLLYKVLDVTNRFRKMCSWYIVMTWVMDNLNTINYLRVLGNWGAGKSRFFKSVGLLCYKPIPTGGATNPAPVYRLMDKWKSTMIFDEFVMNKSEESSAIVQILNSGIQRGNPIWRCDQQNIDDVIPFDPFGPKVIASRSKFDDQALESRCITENIKKTTRKDIPVELPRWFYKEQQTLRNKLLTFRLRNWDKINTNGSINFNLPNIDPRLKQMLLPFFITYNNFDGIKKELVAFGEEFYDEQLKEASTTLDGGIVRAILDLYLYDNNVYITSTCILAKLKDLGYETGKLSDISIGKRRGRLGIRAKQTMVKGKNLKHIIWDEEEMKALVKNYIPRTEHKLYVGAINEVRI